MMVAWPNISAVYSNSAVIWDCSATSWLSLSSTDAPGRNRTWLPGKFNHVTSHLNRLASNWLPPKHVESIILMNIIHEISQNRDLVSDTKRQKKNFLILSTGTFPSFLFCLCQRAQLWWRNRVLFLGKGLSKKLEIFISEKAQKIKKLAFKQTISKAFINEIKEFANAVFLQSKVFNCTLFFMTS